MQLDVETLRDFSKYYGNRYLKGRDDRVYFCHPVRGDDLDNNSMKFSVENSAKDSWETETIRFEAFPVRFWFGLPRLGSVVVESELLYLSHVPTRDGSRGLDHSRMAYHSFNGNERGDLSRFDPYMLGSLQAPHIPRQILYPVRVGLGEALQLLGEGKDIAYALTDRRFGVFLSTTYEYPILTYKDTVVGTIENGELLLMQAGFTVPDLEMYVHPLTVVEYQRPKRKV